MTRPAPSLVSCGFPHLAIHPGSPPASAPRRYAVQLRLISSYSRLRKQQGANGRQVA